MGLEISMFYHNAFQILKKPPKFKEKNIFKLVYLRP